MKLLCLSDLHLRTDVVVNAIDRKKLSPFLARIAALVCEVSPDAVVVPETLFVRPRCACFRPCCEA